MQDIPLIREGQTEIPLNKMIERINPLCRMEVIVGETNKFVMHGDRAVLQIARSAIGDPVQTYILEDVGGTLEIHLWEFAGTRIS